MRPCYTANYCSKTLYIASAGMSQDKLQGVTQARPSRKTTSLSLAAEAVWSRLAVLLQLGAVINPVSTIISLSIKKVYTRV